METFLVSKLFLAGAGTMTFLNFNSRLPHGLQFPLVGAAALLVCGVAFFLPNIWLSQRTKGRQTSIARGLPGSEAKDAMTVRAHAREACSAAFERETAVNDHRKGRPVRKSRFRHNSFIGPRLHSNETGNQNRGFLQSHSLTVQAQRFDTILLSALQ